MNGRVVKRARPARSRRIAGRFETSELYPIGKRLAPAVVDAQQGAASRCACHRHIQRPLRQHDPHRPRSTSVELIIGLTAQTGKTGGRLCSTPIIKNNAEENKP